MNASNLKKFILVWDFPVRVFHWLLVVSFAGAWLTSESEAWQMIHYAFGYSACGLVLFRIIWGLIGTKYARFSQFVRGPKVVIKHIESIFTGNHYCDPGHNPAGGIAMVALMGLVLLVGLTGYWSVKEFYGDVMGEAHEVIASLTMVVVLIHVAAAILMGFLQKENLIKSMVTGKKLGTEEQAIRYPMYFLGIALGIAWVYLIYLVLSGSLPALTQ